MHAFCQGSEAFKIDSIRLNNLKKNFSTTPSPFALRAKASNRIRTAFFMVKRIALAKSSEIPEALPDLRHRVHGLFLKIKMLHAVSLRRK